MTLVALLHHFLFCAALAGLSAALVRGMISVRLLDTPDARKAHDRPTPKGGGVGIVAAFLVGVAVLYVFASFSRLANSYFIGLIVAAFAIAVVSFADDLWNFPFTVKLAAQIGAASAALISGLYVHVFNLPGIGLVGTPLLGMGITLGWILFTTNALNFIDGLNGLAAGVTLIASLVLAVIGALSGGWFVYFASLLLASGVIGFLPFNFPTARIFMGDVGSQFCGFVLAMLGVAASRFETTPLSFTLVPMLLSGVLYDVAFTLLRRASAHENLTQPHRGHLYQLAHRTGLSAPTVTLLYWAFAAWGGLCCLLFLDVAKSDRLPVLLLCLAPQPIWTVWVMRRAARAKLL